MFYALNLINIYQSATFVDSTLLYLPTCLTSLIALKQICTVYVLIYKYEPMVAHNHRVINS